MQKARLSIIAGIGKNRELGKNNQLIWRVSDDLKRLKKLTTGHPIIMGRKTFESIGKPLPERTNIVVTKSKVCIDGCLVYDSLEKAVDAAAAIDQDEVFILGGAQLYTEATPYADRLYLTLFDAEDADADAFFPDYSAFSKVVERKKGSRDDLAYEWVTLERE